MNEKQQAKMQAKIDKIEPVLQQAKEKLAEYYTKFDPNDELDKKELRLIAKMQRKIEKIEAKIAKWREKCGINPVSHQINTLVDAISKLLVVFQ